MKPVIEIRRLQHTGIPVSDMDASKLFYQDLGFLDVMSTTFDYEGGQGRVAMLQLHEIVLELYQLPEPALAQIRSRQNGHIDHVAFDVADIDAAFAAMKSRGYAVEEPAPVFLPFWKSGCKYFNIVGPDGERLEFNQIL